MSYPQLIIKTIGETKMIDLRSDTVTLPSAQMLNTIMSAPLGDDGRANAIGRGEDATVNALEDYAAKLFGKEAAVFFPTGTLANTSALLTWAQPNQKVLMEPLLHIVKSEKTAFSPRFGQLVPIPYDVTEHGTPCLGSIKKLILEHKPALLLLENSHNFRGGMCVSADEMDKLCDTAHEYNVPVHLDGARVFNAQAYTGTPVSRLCKNADSLMFCLSKGLGAPIGSLVVSDFEFSKRLRETRKLLGGTMRQVGVAAAPGMYALKHNILNAEIDNQHAQLFLQRLGNLRHLQVQTPVHSNIVMISTANTGYTPEQLCADAKAEGLHIRPVLTEMVRLVFHSGVSAEDAKEAADIISRLDERLNNGKPHS